MQNENNRTQIDNANNITIRYNNSQSKVYKINHDLGKLSWTKIHNEK